MKDHGNFKWDGTCYKYEDFDFYKLYIEKSTYHGAAVSMAHEGGDTITIPKFDIPDLIKVLQWHMENEQ